MRATSTPVWSFTEPTPAILADFLAAQRDQAFSYAEVGASRGRPPAGYDYDDNQVQLGAGEAVFARAVRALDEWRMFPAAWTRITPDSPPELQEGLTVAMQARAAGSWWLNACRVVYLVDETSPVRRQGFAYGTLPAHVEQGEELFTIEHWPDDTVWYRIQALSRPRFWPVRLAYPWARRLQRKFVRDSQREMLQLVGTPA